MKLGNLKITVLAASAAMLLSGTAANAAITYTSQDVVMAFNAGVTPHTAGNTYLVDLGNLSVFAGLSDGSIHQINTAQSANLLSDLTAAGITDFSAATFSIYGYKTGLGGQPVLLSKAESTTGMQSSPYSAVGTSTPKADMQTMTGTFTAANNPIATSVPNSVINPVGNTNSYGQYVFGSKSPTTAFETFSNPEGGLTQVLNLYQIPNSGTPTLVGGFAFDSSTGVVSFSSNVADFTPVPEPSTAAFAIGMVGLLAFRRVRNQRVTA